MTAAATGAPAQSAEVTRARVAVLVAGYQVDAVLPTKFAVETFIDDLLVVLDSAIDDESVDFTPPQGQWTLARPGEPAIPRWRTLADHQIDDGALLILTTVESAEVFTPIVEDITEALALINEREFSEFDPETAEFAGQVALGCAAVLVAGLLAVIWTASASVLWCALPAVLLGLLCWAVALMLAHRPRRRRLGRVLALSALPLIAIGAAMLVPPPHGVPGPFTAANLAAGAAAAAIVALTLLRSTSFATPMLVATVTGGALLAPAAGAAAFLDISARQVTGGVVFAGLILLTAAPRLAVFLASIRPPDLPDPGKEVSASTLNDIFDAESATPGDELGDPDGEDRRPRHTIESRARLAVTSLRGLIVAAAATLAGAAVLTAHAAPGGIRELVLAVAVAGVLLMRARWYPDRVQASVLVAATTVTVAGTAWALVEAYHTPAARTAVTLAVAAIAAAGCAAGTKLPGVRLSPVVRRIIDLVEYLLILAIPVLSCWIMGVYTAMRRL
ncbi:type VII secretion integral membrane protein EccD [Nocardia yamanashiensis]|uniref:type VII secretion integral membrane protein EccD n=1 Tax=Nocardia yamanashiensis TaxID=209247 RepID=UPI000A4EC543|nr:type VII secretion integral membrane protein EccD [Nocardia yamanashiensis]